MVVKNDTAYVQAGGGIVYDSIPEKEYEESMNKAGALLKALELAESSASSNAGVRYAVTNR
jgi:anthranilate synthase component 1